MSVCDEDLLVYGETLAKEASEICWRASVGRSYYASYHCADAWHDALPSHGMAAAGRGVHRTLIDCLINPTVLGASMRRSKSIGYMLEVMKAARQKSDYELDEHVDQGEAQTVAANSRMLLAKAT